MSEAAEETGTLKGLACGSEPEWQGCALGKCRLRRWHRRQGSLSAEVPGQLPGGESADLGMLCGVTPGGEEVNLAPQGRGRGCLLGRQSRGWTVDVPVGRAGPERTQLSEEAVPGCRLCPISALHTALFGVEILLPCGF